MRIVEADPLHPSPVYRAGAMVASVLLAWATYRFVERYARNRPGAGTLKALGAGMVLLAAAGTAIFFGVPRAAATTALNCRSSPTPDWMPTTTRASSST